MKKKYTYETNDSVVTFRLKTSDKEKLIELANRNQMTVSMFLNYIVKDMISKEVDQ